MNRTDTPTTPAAPQLSAAQWSALGRMADRYAQAGFTVVLQDVILGRALRDVVDHITTRPLSVVVLVPAPAVVAARDAERQQLRGKVAYKPGDEGIEVLDEYLRSATLRLGYWLDTSGLSVAETVADIRAHLETTARVGIDQEDA